jgi:nucleoprotein TPR
LKVLKNETMTWQAAIADAQKGSQLAYSKLEEQNVAWNREREALNSTKVEFEARIAELVQQNNALISQLEQRFTTEPNSPGKDDASEVVKYLRRQRDILQCELDSLKQEHRHLLSQHETMQKVLDETRALLEEERGQNNPRYVAMLSEYQNLLGKVEQYNIVRESNQVLRQENTRLTERCNDANNALRELQQTTLQELNGRVRDLSVQMQTHSEEMRIIREDRDRWRARFNEIISKHEDRVDVVEVQRLREELEGRERDLAARPSTEEFSRLQLENQQLDNTLRLRTEAYERNLAKVNSKLETAKALANELTTQKESSSSNVQQFISSF